MRTRLLVAGLFTLAHSSSFADSAIKKEIPGIVKVDLKFAQVTGSSSVARLANATIKKELDQQVKEFVRQAIIDHKDHRFRLEIPPYELEGETRLLFNHPQLLSFARWTYTFTDGAHGMTYHQPVNFGMIGGQAKLLRLADCLILNQDTRRQLDFLILQKAMNMQGTDWIESGEVNSFTDAQIERFTISRSGLKFYFDPYELGSYASGSFEIELSLKELASLIRRDGPLSILVPSK